ncbi:hypothetical protein [Domibacillus epiphyticus]|uniref:Uncharacterized protein n=1 Tax=Domibacillus epiphyticus TaxID=1714355 RepID=A0A1V2ABT4_9BACI|nr:hypothetical protein [Domibacillus epiphyticus]OMP68458.1 hypothetical protein BTO28_02230 [Domibacillus epiphyticus]
MRAVNELLAFYGVIYLRGWIFVPIFYSGGSKFLVDGRLGKRYDYRVFQYKKERSGAAVLYVLLKAPELSGTTTRLVDEEEVYRRFGGCLPVAVHNCHVHP